MSQGKLDTPTLLTLVVVALILAASAYAIAGLGARAEQDLATFFSTLRSIMLTAGVSALIASIVLSRRLDDLAARTEQQQAWPPVGLAQLPGGLSDPCSGDAALMVAARIRGFSLAVLCSGIGACVLALWFGLRY